MRFSLVVAIAVVGISASGLAQQQNNQFKVKHQPGDKAPQKTTVPMTKTKTSSSANSKDLQSLEHQAAKSSSASRTGGKKSPPLKPVKEKANSPMNFNGGGNGKASSFGRQSSNPYKGRLKQKHSR